MISFYNFVQLTLTAVLIFPRVAVLFPVLLLLQLTGNSPLTPCHRLISSGLLSLGCLPFIFLFLSPLTYLRNTLIFSLCSTWKVVLLSTLHCWWWARKSHSWMFPDSCLLGTELNCCIILELNELCTGLNSSLNPISLLEVQAVCSARCQTAKSLRTNKQSQPGSTDPDGSWKIGQFQYKWTKSICN